MLGHIVDATIVVLTALLCWWSMRTYVLETRGNNTAAKAAATRLARHERLERLREDPSWDNFRACVFVKVDPSLYRGY